MRQNALLRIRDVYIPDPDIFIHPGSRIQQQHQKRRGKKFVVLLFCCSHKYHKIVNNFIFLKRKEIFFSINTIYYNTFCPKICIKLLKIWVGDPRSGIRKASDPGSASATLPKCLFLIEADAAII
jgi:hypothetical protein